MKHFTEEELIAYQLEESREAKTIVAHLEVCPACCSLADSLAETLRVFSADAVPETNLDHAWQKLRSSLPTLAPVPQTTSGRRWYEWLAIPALLVLAAAAYLGVAHSRKPSGEAVQQATLGAGPLSQQPRDPELAGHLASAERLLTEINHSPDGLDEATRGQAHDLLLSNAVYIHKASQEGDPAEVVVLENLGRTLTNLEHLAPAAASPDRLADEKGWHLRMQLNTSGLLLDLRILEQNSGQNGTPRKDPEQLVKGTQ